MSIQGISSPQDGFLKRLGAWLYDMLLRPVEPPTQEQLRRLMGDMTDEQFQEWCDRHVW